MIEWYEILLRLLCAVLLGGLIGFERERKDWAAGIRTHMMACMGAALVMIVSSFGFADILGYPNVELDPSRVASSVVIGIGYLGAGIILVLKRGNIRGLTTASALWTASAVGLAVGGGMYFAASATTALALLVLYAVQIVQKKLVSGHTLRMINLDIHTRIGRSEEVINYLHANCELDQIEIKCGKKKCGIRARVLVAHDQVLSNLDKLQAIPAVGYIKYIPAEKK